MCTVMMSGCGHVTPAAWLQKQQQGHHDELHFVNDFRSLSQFLKENL